MRWQEKINSHSTMKTLFLLLLFSFWVLVIGSVHASETDGTIESTSQHAWSENAGWIDFGTAEGNVHVTDNTLTGYAWGENLGWLSLNCSNDSSCATVDYKVSNTSGGALSGYAYSENAGWIDFDPAGGGVTIDSAGEFTGYAWGENLGWIVFNCAETSSCGTADYKVKTDWRPLSARATPIPTSDNVSVSSGGRGTISQILKADLTDLKIDYTDLMRRLRGALAVVVPDFIQDKIFDKPVITLSPEKLRELLPKQAPLVLGGKWNLVPGEASNFALQLLPAETRLLAQKFPEVADTLKKIGISKMADVGRLESASLDLPGLSTVVGLTEVKEVDGRLLSIGVPTERMSAEAKNKLPSEIVFARGSGERLDINSGLIFDDRGRAKQEIAMTVGKTLTLSVKPSAPVRGVKGYIALTDQTGETALRLPLGSLAASAAFIAPKLAYRQEQPITKDTKFVLSEFEYTDPDGDGIYAALVAAPLVAGRYEVITVMDYLNPQMGAKEIRLIAVVDPEGYVFTKSGKLEASVAGATVSLYWLNERSGQFELWPAKEYLQKNPQTTNKRGNYSFLVPEGKYYLAVKASGYRPYQGEEFTVAEGNGIHVNVELIPTGWGWIDWKVILLAMFALVVAYMSYRLYPRDRAVRI